MSGARRWPGQGVGGDHAGLPPAGNACYEKMATQMFQRWVRGGEIPIIGDVDWTALKAEFLDLVAKEDNHG